MPLGFVLFMNRATRLDRERKIVKKLFCSEKEVLHRLLLGIFSGNIVNDSDDEKPMHSEAGGDFSVPDPFFKGEHPFFTAKHFFHNRDIIFNTFAITLLGGEEAQVFGREHPNPK